MPNTPASAMPSLDGLIDRFLGRHPLVETLGLRFDDVRVDVRSNSRELIAKLAGYFRDFLDDQGPAAIEAVALETPPVELGLDFAAKEPEPGKTRIKEEYVDLPGGRVVRKRLTDMVFLFGEGRNLAVGPCLANDNQVVNFINNRYIELLLNRGCLLGHAAGVAHGGRGLALAGFAGMGKSTLSLKLMAKGLVFVSNDRLLVESSEKGLVMHGVAKMPRVNPGTILGNDALRSVMTDEERDRFSKLPPDELWNLEHKYDAFIDECFGPGKFSLTAPMKGLAILNWRRGGSPFVMRRVDLAERRDLLPAFMKDAGLFVESGESMARLDLSEDAYLDRLARCDVFELTGGVDFHAAADALYEYLDKA